jgi:hypothetical protein
MISATNAIAIKRKDFCFLFLNLISPNMLII